MNLVWAAFVYFSDYEDPSSWHSLEARLEFCGAVLYEKTGNNTSRNFCVEMKENGYWRQVDMLFDPSLCPDDDNGYEKRECYATKSMTK